MNVTVFDLETAGLDERYPVIQFAAVALEDFHEVDSIEIKIQFSEFEADAEALAVNSYNREVWEREAVPEVKAVQRIQGFLYDNSHKGMISKRTGRPYSVARLAGHNAERFDAPRLQALFKRHAQFLPAHPQVLDTCQLALWKTRAALESYKLEDLCARYGIDATGAHDALSDVRMCAKLMKRLMEGKA